MTKEDIIIELVTSLNKGDTLSHNDRVHIAILQYNQMVEAGIIAGQPIEKVTRPNPNQRIK